MLQIMHTNSCSGKKNQNKLHILPLRTWDLLKDLGTKSYPQLYSSVSNNMVDDNDEIIKHKPKANDNSLEKNSPSKLHVC